MKEYGNYLTEKPFSCNVDECSMKSKNESLLATNKKKHDMTLNIGLISKGTTTFADQTPTPTQFIRNCEEVGLFQDLQKINPFEETFKKAAEAVKAGQPICLEKSLTTNSPDDTLHTPNIFPHITDGPNINQERCVKAENIPTNEDILIKEEPINENGITISSNLQETKILNSKKTSFPVGNTVKSERKGDKVILDVSKNHLINKDILVKKEPVNENGSTISSNLQKPKLLNSKKASFPVGSRAKSESKGDKVILNVPEGHFVQFITPESAQASCNMVLIKNSDTLSDTLYSTLPLTVKEKLKKNLSDKKNNKITQQKVPISKCPSRKVTNSLTSKFSKFSKNALKLISKLENSESASRDLIAFPTKIQKKKSDKFHSKESRSEFLARSRAASFRCREKKKMYVLYLEKVNNELSAANQNLQLINISLRKQIRELYTELAKHKSCSAADNNTEIALSTAMKIFDAKTSVSNTIPQLSVVSNECTKQFEFIRNETSVMPTTTSMMPTNSAPESEDVTSFTDNIADPNSFTFDVAEVTLNDKIEENEIPLNECNKPPDIIVRFNSVGNDFPTTFPPDHYLGSYVESTREDVRLIYSEHSYFFKKPIVDVDKQFVNYKTFNETLTNVPAISRSDSSGFDIDLKKNGALRNLTSLNAKGLMEQRTPPPLIMLRPFKKRTLQKKQTEKT